MRRPVVVWMLALPLAVVGSQVGHNLGYRLATPDAARRSQELAATGHAYLSYLPLALAVCSMVVLVALALETRSLVRGRTAAAPSARAFALLAPGIFAFQEYFERLMHAGVFPWDAWLEPTFVAGLLLQLPVAFATYLLARLLVGVVRSLGRLLAHPPRLRLPVAPVCRPVVPLARPRVPVLALGYGSRGPPL